MSYINGTVAVEIDNSGNVNLVRIDLPKRSENMYCIDSTNVHDLTIIQDGQKVDFNVEVACDKTMLTFSVKPNEWIGILYQKENAVRNKSGVFIYSDNWPLIGDYLFMLLMPFKAVPIQVKPKSLDKNRYKFDDNIVLSQYGSGVLEIDLSYKISSTKFADFEAPILERQCFPSLQQSHLLKYYKKSSEGLRVSIGDLKESLNWLARGTSFFQIIKWIGIL